MLNVAGKVIIDDRLPVGAIQIGFYGVGIADYRYERSIWQNFGTVEFKGKAYLGSGSRISNSGHLTMGDGVSITANSAIVCHKSVKIGADALISWDVLIMDTDFHKIYDFQGTHVNEPKEIIIGDHCWICSRSLVLKGANIPSNSIIAANSTITGKNIEKEGCIIGSNAVIIKENIKWSK